MVTDYSTRRAVSKNRPKKQPVGLLVPIVTIAIIIAFGSGLFTGWLLFHAKEADPLEASAVQQQISPPETATPPVTGVPAQHQSLTFYETLSKGNSNALIGSGINPKMPGMTVIHKPDVPGAPIPAATPGAIKPVAPQTAPVDAPAATPVPIPTNSPTKVVERTVDTGKPAETKTLAKTTFAVQVGSYKSRAEAEEMLARSKATGLPAYIVEARTDRGTWYRVRMGKKLDPQAASQLASKAGKGAIPVPE